MTAITDSISRNDILHRASNCNKTPQWVRYKQIPVGWRRHFHNSIRIHWVTVVIRIHWVAGILMTGPAYGPA